MKKITLYTTFLFSIIFFLSIPTLQASAAKEYKTSFTATEQAKNTQLAKKLTKYNERIAVRAEKRIVKGKAPHKKGLGWWGVRLLIAGFLFILLSTLGIGGYIGSAKYLIGYLLALSGFGLVLLGLLFIVLNAFIRS